MGAGEREEASEQVTEGFDIPFEIERGGVLGGEGGGSERQRGQEGAGGEGRLNLFFFGGSRFPPSSSNSHPGSM